jgi:tetraacyldisaccharide 4'-kinase
VKAREILLLPVAALYGMAVAARNSLFDRGLLASRRFDVPVVRVGNITVGGTGKTPHVEALVARLAGDYRVACLSRGYKRESTGFRLVETCSTPAEAGDEPLQVKRKFPGVTVAVDADRVRGIETLLRLDPPPGIIIMDDGFQHRRVRATLNIVLVDYNRPVHDDRLLPAGRLREPVSALRRADFIIVTKCPSGISSGERQAIARRLKPGDEQRVLFTAIAHGPVTPIDGTSRCSLSPDTSVLLVTGIAAPAPYRRYLETLAGTVVPLAFPDHHAFTRRDICRVVEAFRRLPAPACIFTTEKDATRLLTTPLPREIAGKIFYVPVAPRFLAPEDELLNTIIAHARQYNKE